MAIKYIPRPSNYVGLSTDDKTIIQTEGSIIYYTDTKVREVYNNGAWTEYVENVGNSDAENLSLSKIGNKSITGTSAVTPATGYNFVMIQVIEDMVVSAQTDTAGALNADLTAFTTIPAGTVIYGTWDSIQLSSGEAIGHYEAE